MENDSVGAADNFRLTNAIRNLSRNLSIKKLRIIVNSSRGAIEKSSDTTGFVDAERLWEMTREKCNSKYFQEGGFRAWRDHQCAVLLSSSQFCTLQACDGVAYPIQLQIEAEVECRSVDVSALDFVGGVDSYETRAAAKTCAKLSADYIRAQAQCTAFYQKVLLSTTETAATVNSMNYPLSSAERLMNAAGQSR